MSDLKQKLASMTKNFTQTSSGIVKTTKLSINLANEEENLKSIYQDIGKKVHEIYMFGGSLGAFFDDKYKELQAVEFKVQDLRNQLEVAKGTKSCPKCAKSVDRNAEFCPKCGFRMSGVIEYDKTDISPEAPPEAFPTPQPEPVMEPVNTPKEIPRSLKVCSVCGSENGSNEKFCLSCGRML